jgi:bifunctional DNase/RNase
VAGDSKFNVVGLRFYDEGGSPLIVLQEVSSTRTFVLAVSKATAHSVLAALDAEYRRAHATAPLEHDLAEALADVGGVRLERAVIDGLTEGRVVAATLEVRSREGGEIVRLEARPSDAIALAVRVGAPIFVAVDVVARLRFRTLEELPFREIEPEDLFDS